MYAYLGITERKKAKRGVLEPTYILAHSVLASTPYTLQRPLVNKNVVPYVVNNITDELAQTMIAYVTESTPVRGILCWHECDTYARPTGRMLFVTVLPNQNLGPSERSNALVPPGIPNTELLRTVGVPKLPRYTTRTMKAKEKKKNEKLVCGTDGG